MTLFDLIERGYFLKELPPPFNTNKFASGVSTILTAWTTIFANNTDTNLPTFVLTQLPGETLQAFRNRKKAHRYEFISRYSSSKGTTFSISKGKLSRRFLQIPNPKHFSLLCEKIAGNWPVFEEIYQLSEYSQSYPIHETDTNKRAVSTRSKSVAEFRNELLKVSIDKRLEVRVDISKFYPTIYTHSITWALLGKEKAKYYFHKKDNLDTLIASGDADATLYRLADSIDIAIRSCQERQSIGIPIGPDTSHIIAEAISCRLDQILKDKFGILDLKVCRYFDDYYLYVSTRDEADKILKGLQLILSDYQLEINEGKIRIREFPFAFEDEFTTTLFLFDFKKTNLTNSLKHYFSLIWAFVEKNPKKADWIFKYSLRIFEYSTIVIPKNSWKTFEDLLLKTALIEPATLDIVTRVLLTYKNYLDDESKVKLSKLLNAIINEHSLLNHNFEVSWALWIAKTFEIEIDEDASNNIIESKDSVSNLILLDLSKNTTLVKGHPRFVNLEIELKDNILFSENWLLAYEGVKKGWLNPTSPTLLDDNLFFKLLKENDVEFYDTTKQMTTYVPRSVTPTDTYDAPVRETVMPTIINENTEGNAYIHTVPSGLET